MSEEKKETHHSEPKKSNPPVTGRSPGEIRHNDIVHFIVNVRKLSSQTINIERNMRQIKNMANVIFRHYIGYTAKGEYRIKHRKERCFSEDVARLGLEDPFDNVLTVTSSEKVVKDAQPAEKIKEHGHFLNEDDRPVESAPENVTIEGTFQTAQSDDRADLPVVDLTDFVPPDDNELEFFATSEENLSESCMSEGEQISSITISPDGEVLQSGKESGEASSITITPDGEVLQNDDGSEEALKDKDDMD